MKIPQIKIVRILYYLSLPLLHQGCSSSNVPALFKSLRSSSLLGAGLRIVKSEVSSVSVTLNYLNAFKFYILFFLIWNFSLLFCTLHFIVWISKDVCYIVTGISGYFIVVGFPGKMVNGRVAWLGTSGRTLQKQLLNLKNCQNELLQNFGI